ncbi:hypothetical protein GS429_13915 [Natronorubrum sp. JWXQ-INN-674]|uniref:DUF8159 domain-containing protein n=1 Tax=Natronorubrum halalkaliphilum TaxID=2691917 RepID=A0A6B0VPG1_9EURY|nr:hypothetical protein [Natronorubrum halalkaliphilum]MXV63145.1 hypothetical protein [Natronorubrum halalkaliphilum]
MTDQHPVGVALENRLMSHGIYVTDWTRQANGANDSSNESADADRGDDATVPDGTDLVLEYETVSEHSSVDSNEVGAVVRALLSIADEREWTPGRLEVTSLTTDGDVRGHWHVERAWFEALGTDIDDLEFSQRVLETVRSTRVDESGRH